MDAQEEARRMNAMLAATEHLHTPEAIDRRLMATARKVHDLVPRRDVVIWRAIAIITALAFLACALLEVL